MKFINQFDTLSEFNSAKGGLVRPNVSLVKDDMSVKYLPIVAEVGDYLFSDMTYGKTLGSKTPIAICVAPADHFSDGKARWMSLVNMSLSNPELGSKEVSDGSGSDNYDFAPKWGPMDQVAVTANDISPYNLKYSDELVTEDNPLGFIPEVNVTEAVHYGYFVTDYDNGAVDAIYPYNSKAFTRGTYISSGNSNKPRDYVPYQFNEDGSLSDLFVQSIQGSAYENMQGFELSQSILALATATETEGPISNVTEPGHYPAVMTCHRFTAGVESLKGLWYLPTMGELSYIMASITKLNSKLSDLGDQAIGIGTGEIITGPVTTSDRLGDILMSSSERNSSHYWRLSNVYGDIISSASKDYDGYNDRVRAFLAY